MNTAFMGKKLLVVGGTSGMGLATAKRVVENGGSVVLVGNRRQKAEQARQALAAAGKVDVIVADLTSESGMQQVMAAINAEHQDISLLVNAAGVFFPKPFIEHEMADYDRYMHLN
ncbi:sugar dehydrogenase, partial [Klebsiella michiganensis]